MIGLWSSDAASIVALDFSHGNPAFFIGSLLNLTVPDFSSSLYLFMATNDGIFSDNSEAYSVRIDSIGSADISQVAVPPAWGYYWVGALASKGQVGRGSSVRYKPRHALFSMRRKAYCH